MTNMSNLQRLIIAIAFLCLVLAGRAQSTAWKTLQCTKASLTYPPTWHLTEERRGQQRRYTLTPDSMQNLSIRMFEILELPVGGDHDYSHFKQNFNLILHPNDETNTKILKTEEITFKGHKCMYGEMISSSLPQKVFAIDAGNEIYVVTLTERRYSQIADLGLKRDENAILNSITINQ